MVTFPNPDALPEAYRDGYDQADDCDPPTSQRRAGSDPVPEIVNGIEHQRYHPEKCTLLHACETR